MPGVPSGAYVVAKPMMPVLDSQGALAINRRKPSTSHGQMSFCRAFAEDTVLVVLDEPTEGVQPENIARMVEAVEGAAPGRAFLIVEQNLNFIERTADHVHLLDHGECVFEAANGSGLRDELTARLRI